MLKPLSAAEINRENSAVAMSASYKAGCCERESLTGGGDFGPCYFYLTVWYGAIIVVIVAPWRLAVKSYDC
jgi:hypothetical protein